VEPNSSPEAVQAAAPEANAPGLATKVKEVSQPEAKLLESLGGESKPSTIEVMLPPAPELGRPAIPDKGSEGHWSIEGLRRNRTTQLAEGAAGTEVTVQGWVQEIYVAPECPEGEVCPPAKQPYLWITDAADTKGSKRAMMVVNYAFAIPEWDAKRWSDVPEVMLEVGKRYVFKGRFKLFSDTGFAYDEGLLEFVAVQGGAADWVYPRGAPWHPLEIARMEADSARLLEAMGK